MHDGQRAQVVRELVESHYESLYRFAYRLSGSASDAEDLTQQAFLTAQRKLEQLRDPERARSWLLTIVRNTYLKSRRRGRFIAFSGMASPPEPTAEVLDESVLDAEELQAALDELPDDFRMPILLFYFESLSYREIADRLDVPIGTVMSRLSRGKAFLRSRLSGPDQTAHAVGASTSPR
ncbi:ECF RNA polymerase sigma factor SigE [Maioricimonas rarisocia]|uniref:RNA polymerase sigma factor n=1 Tax=Maioricimonas rarisocia TaxID=2528026 RepID=A0A517ZCG5_9PLAN|nr:sigma-70 family RNA polymerase sigma factor [Maioricimonas rarisocia]QDU40193.1 ECF RNA polymerase sigma factor SigE [Maioricimonas rarisocia]